MHERTHQSDVGSRKEYAPDLYWKLIHLHVTMPGKTVADLPIHVLQDAEKVRYRSSQVSKMQYVDLDSLDGTLL